MLDELFDDLDAELSAEPEGDLPPEARLPDEVTDYWAPILIRRLARRRRRMEDARTVADAEKARIDDWLKEQAHRYRTDELEQALAGFHAARLVDDPDAKTLRFPAGDLISRAGQAEWDFDESFLEWAERERPELLRRKVEIDRVAAKKAVTVALGVAFDEAGEVVPGVTVTPGATSFTVKCAVELGGF